MTQSDIGSSGPLPSFFQHSLTEGITECWPHQHETVAHERCLIPQKAKRRLTCGSKKEKRPIRVEKLVQEAAGLPLLQGMPIMGRRLCIGSLYAQ